MFEECLYFNTNALARTVTRIWTEAFSKFDLSPPHAFLLRVVLSNPGLLPNELAEELNLSRSTVTRFLDSLEKRGLLYRSSSDDDGRELHIYPSEDAKAIHNELDNTGKELTKMVKKLVGFTEITSTVSTLREIKSQLDKQ